MYSRRLGKGTNQRVREWQPGDPSEIAAFIPVQRMDGEDVDKDHECEGGEEGWFNRFLGNDSTGTLIFQGKKKREAQTQRKELMRW